MNDYVKPNRIYEVEVPSLEAGKLLLSPGHDFLHHFAPIGCYVLKYMDQSEEGTVNKNVWLETKAALWIIEHCEIEVLERIAMRQEEYTQYLEFQTATLSDIDFGIVE